MSRKKKANLKLFTTGYAPIYKKAKDNRYIWSCDSCKYYYQGIGDKEELCQNSNVLEYDIKVDGNRVFCGWWKMNEHKEEK